MIFLDEQLHFLHFLQQARSPSVDAFFRFLNFFDTDYFVCILIAFLWIGCSWRWGSRFAFLMIVSGLINTWAKLAFGLPRPFFYDPSLAIVILRDYGFPSGGAQNSLLFGCLIIYFWKSRWAWPLGIFYALLISFSRMFLGVHFPVDILGGWLIGLTLFYLFIKFDPLIERLSSKRPFQMLYIILAIALVVRILFHDFKTVFLLFSAVPIAIGLYISTRYDLYLKMMCPNWKKFLLGLFGVISAFASAFLVLLLPLNLPFSTFMQTTIAGLWISLVASPICKRIFHCN